MGICRLCQSHQSLSCLDFASGLVKAILHPHPNYLLKVPFSTINPVILVAFCPPPFTTPEQERFHLLCPVCALQIYVHRTSQWLKSEQLFICYGGHNQGAAATKHTMSHWVRDANAIAYEAHGQASSLGVRAHSTRLHLQRLWQEVSPCSKCVMRQAGPFRTHLSDSIVWMSMLLRARVSLSQHPRVMSETSSMLVRAHTSSAAALVFSFP